MVSVTTSNIEVVRCTPHRALIITTSILKHTMPISLVPWMAERGLQDRGQGRHGGATRDRPDCEKDGPHLRARRDAAQEGGGARRPSIRPSPIACVACPSSGGQRLHHHSVDAGRLYPSPARGGEGVAAALRPSQPYVAAPPAGTRAAVSASTTRAPGRARWPEQARARLLGAARPEYTFDSKTTCSTSTSTVSTATIKPRAARSAAPSPAVCPNIDVWPRPASVCVVSLR